jgi:hypothetical protein
MDRKTGIAPGNSQAPEGSMPLSVPDRAGKTPLLRSTKEEPNSIESV